MCSWNNFPSVVYQFKESYLWSKFCINNFHSAVLGLKAFDNCLDSYVFKKPIIELDYSETKTTKLKKIIEREKMLKNKWKIK